MGSDPFSGFVKSFSDGAESETLFAPQLPRNDFLFVRWTADDRSLLFDDVLERRIIFRRVNRDTGAQEVVFDRITGGGWLFSHAALTGDGKALYYSVACRTNPATPEWDLVLFRRDLETGEERELYRTTSTGMGLRDLAISPDGQQLAFLVDDLDGSALRIVPADGGSHRELLRTTTQLRPCAWMKDGRHLLVVEQNTKLLATLGHVIEVQVSASQPHSSRFAAPRI
jgi:dipeptidyl aminopeptidase/acylaminoacyl peptidase